MPDKDGKLTEADRKKIAEWLGKKIVAQPCPSCMRSAWAVGDHLLNGLVFHKEGLVLGGPTYPTFLLVCQNCMYVRQYMAVPVLGLGAEEEDKTPEAPAEPPKAAASG